eukprot:jgi/Hompol1/2257/HPOL_005388-RA
MRWNAESKTLDLDHINDDPTVSSQNIRVFDYADPSSKLGPVLCKLIQEHCPGLETLLVGGNRLKSLQPFSTLHQRVPTLVNVSFMENELSSSRDIEPLCGKEFKQLREIIFIGNPFRERELARSGGEINYISSVCRNTIGRYNANKLAAAATRPTNTRTISPKI